MKNISKILGLKYNLEEKREIIEHEVALLRLDIIREDIIQRVRFITNEISGKLQIVYNGSLVRYIYRCDKDILDVTHPVRFYENIRRNKNYNLPGFSKVCFIFNMNDNVVDYKILNENKFEINKEIKRLHFEILTTNHLQL